MLDFELFFRDSVTSRMDLLRQTNVQGNKRAVRTSKLELLSHVQNLHLVYPPFPSEQGGDLDLRMKMSNDEITLILRTLQYLITYASPQIPDSRQSRQEKERKVRTALRILSWRPIVARLSNSPPKSYSLHTAANRLQTVHSQYDKVACRINPMTGSRGLSPTSQSPLPLGPHNVS